MSAHSIVEHFYVVEDLGTRLLPRSTDLLFDEFLFHVAEGGFSHCIVPTVSSSNHKLLAVNF
jgi:hypothetical protein